MVFELGKLLANRGSSARNTVLWASSAIVLSVSLFGLCTPSFARHAKADAANSSQDGGIKKAAPGPCDTLSSAIRAHIAAIQAVKQKTNPEKIAPPPTVLEALNRALGNKRDDTELLVRIGEERQTAEQQIAVLLAKGCPHIDIDQALMEAPDKSAPRVWNAFVQRDNAPQAAN